jgi:type II secretory pathway component PulL
MGVVFAKERGEIIMDLNAGDSRQIDKIEQQLADMDLKMEEVSEIPEIFKD